MLSVNVLWLNFYYAANGLPDVVETVSIVHIFVWVVRRSQEATHRSKITPTDSAGIAPLIGLITTIYTIYVTITDPEPRNAL